MENLKIRVADEAESKEAQELFFELGYKWFGGGKNIQHLEQSCSSGFGYLVAWSTGCFTNVIQCGCGAEDAKEITLQELRDMVNPMKEYLEKQADDSYKLVMRGVVKKDDDIEVPEGADVAFKKKYGDGLCFFQCVGDNGADWCSATRKWISRIHPVDDWYFKNSPWQRHKQPEELPFIDDGITDCREEIQEIYKPSDFGASSLNDQYAEIEQVRQSGMKFDSNKPRHSLLPKGAVNSVIEVLEFGAKKYSADNWQEVDNAKERYYNAAMRHIDLWWNGEKLDPETNVHHLAHAATNLFFLMWFDNK